jgi:hypothetical protein
MLELSEGRAHSTQYDWAMVMHNLDIGFLLDRQWHALRGEMETTKRPALIALAKVMAETATPYAIIRGIALQSIEQSLGRRSPSHPWTLRPTAREAPRRLRSSPPPLEAPAGSRGR